MNRIASILTVFSLVVLFCVAPAQAESDGQRMIAAIPFDFTGDMSFPAGRYEFLNGGTGAGIVVVRGANARSWFTLAAAPFQENGLPEKSMLKFDTVDGHYALVQIWHGPSAVGTELRHGHPSERLADSPTLPGTVAGRR
jgi:hypothetical protein